MNAEEPKRKFEGVWIPAAIWLDRSLSITEKVMLIEINSLQDRERGCFASNEHFSKFFDLSKSRVSEIISGLVARDFVRVVLIREGKQIVGRQIWMTENGKLTVAGVAQHQAPSSGNTHTPLRETRIPLFGKHGDPFGKGCDPSSEKAKERSTDSNNTERNTHTENDEPVCVIPSTAKPGTAGSCCQVMIANGIQGCNPCNPTLLALLEAGANEEEFAYAAREAAGRGNKKFSYVLGIVRKQREDAAKLVLHKGRLPNKQELLEQSNLAATAGWMPPELRGVKNVN